MKKLLTIIFLFLISCSKYRTDYYIVEKPKKMEVDEEKRIKKIYIAKQIYDNAPHYSTTELLQMSKDNKGFPTFVIVSGKLIAKISNPMLFKSAGLYGFEEGNVIANFDIDSKEHYKKYKIRDEVKDMFCIEENKMRAGSVYLGLCFFPIINN